MCQAIWTPRLQRGSRFGTPFLSTSNSTKENNNEPDHHYLHLRSHH
nr:MAG TPA: hypothetical protein [Caudoviricetes sp.]